MHGTPSAAHDSSAPHTDHAHQHHPYDDHQRQHHHHPYPVHDPNEYEPHDPDEPPPSYDESIGAPLLAGQISNYGAFAAYSDASSIASSEVESTARTLPEWVGQALVVFVFVAIFYGFWTVINTPGDPDGVP